MTVPTTHKTHTPVPFTLTLDNFEGPYDLLLHLISRKKLDITDIALADVTDEFLTYIRTAYTDAGNDTALNTASEFLVTAATLLELKTARLLPRGTTNTAHSVELLEARDLLFARLLQYRAYRDVATVIEEKYTAEATRYARTVALEPAFTKVLPELVFDITPDEFARIAVTALRLDQPETPEDTEPPAVDTEHLHTPATTIAAEETYLLTQLRERNPQTFTELTADAPSTEIIVVRFLALLELYKEGRLDAAQDTTLGTITITALDTPTPENREDTA